MKIAVTAAVALGVTTLGARAALRRVAATPSEVAATLPGDDLIADATVSMDRAATFAVAPDVLWPWIAQLGKGRGGWYFPRWLDALTPRARRSLRTVAPSLSDVRVGDDHPDWGPGEPVLRVVSVDPGRSLVYHSLRDRANDYRWPTEGSTEVMHFTWSLLLTPVPEGTRLHLRVRVKTKTRLFATLGDVFDGLTVALLFPGLRERLAR